MPQARPGVSSASSSEAHPFVPTSAEPFRLPRPARPETATRTTPFGSSSECCPHRVLAWTLQSRWWPLGTASRFRRPSRSSAVASMERAGRDTCRQACRSRTATTADAIRPPLRRRVVVSASSARSESDLIQQGRRDVRRRDRRSSEGEVSDERASSANICPAGSVGAERMGSRRPACTAASSHEERSVRSRSGIGTHSRAMSRTTAAIMRPLIGSDPCRRRLRARRAWTLSEIPTSTATARIGRILASPKGARGRRCESAKVRGCEGAKVRRCRGCEIKGARVRGCEGAKVRGWERVQVTVQVRRCGGCHRRSATERCRACPR